MARTSPLAFPDGPDKSAQLLWRQSSRFLLRDLIGEEAHVSGPP
jgi:hypothetical protein